jgi:hypothetical protein
MDKLRETAAQNGDLETADRYTELMDKFELITPQKAEALKKNNKDVVDRSVTTQMANAIHDVNGYQAAIDFVMAADIDTDLKKSIVSDINFKQANQQDVLEQQREKDRDTISKLIRSGQSAEIAIEGSSLDEKEQFTWFERARAESERRVRGIPIQTNQSIKGDLESMAYNIHNGSVALEDFIAQLEGARYDDKSIDDSAYDELRSLATREFKTYQSNEMGSRISFARNQLVTMPSDLGFEEQIRKITDKFQKEQAITLRKLELDNLDQYRKALNDWFADNPEADADEIYTKGRSLLAHYRKTPDELRRAEAQRRGQAPEPSRTPKTPTLKTPTKSKRILVEKNGQRFTVPQEQLAEAEKQGYKRVK